MTHPPDSYTRTAAVSDLQSELENLQVENARLRKLLKLTDTEAAPAHGTQGHGSTRRPALWTGGRPRRPPRI